PPCGTIWPKRQSREIRKPYPYAATLICNGPSREARVADADADRQDCCISRALARRTGPFSGSSRGGYADIRNETYFDRSAAVVHSPPIAPNAPCGRIGSAFHRLSSQR